MSEHLRAPSAVLRAVLACVLFCLLSGCTGGPQERLVPGPGPSDIKVDTPELEALKAQTGMEDCASGPGGGALPSLTLPCLGGGTPVDLASLRGPMVVSLWFAGCPPCRKEMPALQAFYEDYGTEVPVLGVDFQDLFPASALDTVRQRGVTYPSVADPGGEMQALSEFAKLPGLPAMYFLDEAGAIAHVVFKGLDSEEQIVDLVREHLGVDL